MPPQRDLKAERHATLEAAKRDLFAAQTDLRLALRGVKSAPRADKVTIDHSLRAAFDNLLKVKAALVALERLA